MRKDEWNLPSQRSVIVAMMVFGRVAVMFRNKRRHRPVKIHNKQYKQRMNQIPRSSYGIFTNDGNGEIGVNQVCERFNLRRVVAGYISRGEASGAAVVFVTYY